MALGAGILSNFFRKTALFEEMSAFIVTIHMNDQL